MEYFTFTDMPYTTLISAQELLQELDNTIVIIDCRFSLADTEQGRRDYATDHIPSAIYAHLDQDLSGEIIAGHTSRHPLPSVDYLTKLFSAWGIDETVQVVAYDDKAGAIAARLWWMLRWLGHEKVAVLDGGWPYWYKHNFPVSSAEPNPKSRVFKPIVNSHQLVDVAFVDKIREDHSFKLVDSRTKPRYQGLEEPIDPVAGHIPGAVNAPFPENVNEQGLLHTSQDLYNRFTAILGGHNPEEAIFYCGSGVTACHNLLAMAHAGLGHGKLYAGSWSEWIIDETRPVGTTKM